MVQLRNSLCANSLHWFFTTGNFDKCFTASVILFGMARYFSSAVLLLIVLNLSLSPAAQANEDCLRIASGSAPHNYKLLESLEPHFRKNGVCVTVEIVSSKRAGLMLRQGRLDGEFLRVASYQSLVEGYATRVPEALSEGQGLLVTRAELASGHLGDLAGERIAVGLGVVWDKFYFPKGTIPVVVEDYASGLVMLRTGRVAGLMIDNRNFSLLEKTSGEEWKAHEVVKLTGHLYLHNRHRGLVDHFDEAIRNWKAERAGNGGS